MAFGSRLFGVFRQSPAKQAERMEKARYKKEQKMKEDCGLIFKDGIARASELRGEEKLRHLERVRDAIEHRAVQEFRMGAHRDSYYGKQVVGMIRELSEKMREAEHVSLSEKIREAASKEPTNEEMEFMRKIKSPPGKEVFGGRMRAENRALKEAEGVFKKGMEKAGRMHGAEKIKFLENLENVLYKDVVRTYDPRAEKQSHQHQRASELMAKVGIERMRTQAGVERAKAKK